MTAETVRQLQDLVRTDPAAAPLARLQVEVLQASAEPVWDAGVPDFDRSRLEDGLPLLQGQMLAVDPERVRGLLARLATLAGHSDSHSAPNSKYPALDPLVLLEASITQDADRLAALAGAMGADADLLTTLAGLAALPLLLACGRKAAPLLERSYWEAGYCPVCAAWPALAELRGLERRRWLRCGRCGAGWTLPGRGCPFCGNDNFRTLGYLAPEADTETRRAATCDRCRSYLKTLTTLGPILPAEIGLHDLKTLELDMAALEQEYARPDAPGFPLDVRMEPLRRRTGWLRRRR